jgi:pimeloyl-ACP methyl ester carboxylesterase
MTGIFRIREVEVSVRALWLCLVLALPVLLLVAASAEKTRTPFSLPVSFETSDGFTLKGDLTSSADANAPVAILLHMYRSNRSAWAPLVPELAAAGFTVLAIDQRAHGESKWRRGERVDVAAIPRADFGELVRDGVRDVKAAALYLARQGLATDRIVLIGASYGCSVSLLSAQEVEGVRALVLLSPGTNYFGVNVLAAASSFPGPLLVVAAEDDRQAAESARIVAARHRGADDLEIYRSGGHGTRLFGPRPQLKRRIVEFAAKAVEPVPSQP